MSDLQPNRLRMKTGRRVPVNTLLDVLEAPFPERRTIHWVPPDRVTTDEFSIVVTSDVLLQTSRHVAQSLEHERGGFLLGNRYRCPNTGREYIIVDQYVEADFTESTDVSLTFTHEAWGLLDDKMTGKYYGKKLVGWYHSHPRMSIFLSEHDLAIHRERFPEYWMVALVLEPEKHMGGFFVWTDGKSDANRKIDPNRYVNFYELLEGEARETVVSWKNYVGVDPLMEGTEPPMGRVNTLTVSALAGPPGGEDQNGAAVQPPPPASRLPDWLHGNLSYFSIAALALLVFIFTLGAVVVWPRVTAWWHSSRTAAEQQLDEDPFKDFAFDLESRGTVDFDEGKINVVIDLLNLPEGAAERGLRTAVTIDGQEANIQQSQSGAIVLVSATVAAPDKVREIKEGGGKDTQLQVRGSCELNGLKQPFAVNVPKLQVLPGEAMNLALSDFKKESPQVRRQDQTLAQQQQQQQQQRQRQQEQERQQQQRQQQQRQQQQQQPQQQQRQQQQQQQQPAESGRKVELRRQVEDLRRQANELTEQLRKYRPEDSQYKRLIGRLKTVTDKIFAKQKELNKPEKN